MTPAVRALEERTRATLHRLEHDVDAWVATADPAIGTPYLISLSYLWERGALLISNPAASPTSRNLQAAGKALLGVGPTRDLILIEGTARALDAAELTPELGDAFAAKSGFDPRELEGRDLMRYGEWLVHAASYAAAAKTSD